MWAPTMAIALCATGASAFIGAGVVQPTGCATTRPHSCGQALSMSGSGIATTRARKAEVIEEVSELLSKSTLVFAVPSANVGANDVVRLRKGLPDGCTARVVKNKLMRIACKGSEFEELSEITTGENFWMFVEGEENLGAPIKYIAEFAKSVDGDKESWKSPFKAGIFAGSLLDGPGIVAVSKLPTKQDLMQRLAVAVNTVPTRLGRSINLVPTKVGRAVRLAFAEGDGEGEAAAPAETEAVAEVEAAAPAAEEAAPAAEEEAPAAE